MKMIAPWGKSVAIVALGLSSVAYLNAPSTAVTHSTLANVAQKSEFNLSGRQSNFQLAQGLVGQCRAAKQRIFVYSQRSTTSQTVRTIAPNEQVTLADNGAAGWVAISSPEPGYIRVSELTTCQAANRPTPNPAPNPAPNQTSSLCRIVTYNGPEGGLAIRSQADRNAPRVNGVKLGDRVTLRTSPPPRNLDKDGRDWVEVTAPSRGWISNGFPSAKSSNTASCP